MGDPNKRQKTTNISDNRRFAEASDEKCDKPLDIGNNTSQKIWTLRKSGRLG